MPFIIRGDRILNIGCGSGESAIHLAETRDCQVNNVTRQLLLDQDQVTFLDGF